MSYLFDKGMISIHAPLAGCDTRQLLRAVDSYDFNPRTPCGVRLARAGKKDPEKDFNPRTPCGVRRAALVSLPARHGISIHAPLAGCDLTNLTLRRASSHFNPRTPCGVRLIWISAATRAPRFQSTHPLRGATRCLCLHGFKRELFQSTHPLRGATL